jgi:hypothetical protein
MRVTLGSAAAVALAVFAVAGCGRATSSAQASGGEAQGEMVAAVGCPISPTAGCVTIAAQGKSYDISSAGVDLSRGVGVSLTGRAAGEVTACGPKLTDVKVDYLSLQCGAPAPAAPAN